MTDRSQDALQQAGCLAEAGRLPVVRVGWLQRAFMAGLLLVILVDGLPRSCALHRRAAAQLRPLLAPLGIYQSRWLLFAPEPPTWNEYLTADLLLDDGRTVQWRSPIWRELSRWERFQRSRQMSYYTAVLHDAREGKASPLWPVFADYVARRQEANSEGKVVRAELTAHWVDFNSPGDDWRLIAQSIAPIHKRKFFEKDYP